MRRGSLIVLLSVVVFLFCCVPSIRMAAPQAKDIEALPSLGVGGRQVYEKFLGLEPNRAFAISPTGAWGYASKRGSRTKATMGALYNCNKASRNICRVYALNDDVIFQRYTAFEQQSAAALEKLNQKAFSRSEYADELKDYRVTREEGLKQDPYHDGTPLTLKEVRTIKTVDLVKLMTSPEPPILIDVLEGDGHRTLPGAYWVKGAGLAGGDDANADMLERLRWLVSGLTKSNKATPIVFFCLDSLCWLSYNASLRARDTGYSNVFWYRGGVKAWEAAHLEVLEAVQYGQMR
jgi:PQQ-dependent catabolism-associated CXXCW motif protein